MKKDLQLKTAIRLAHSLIEERVEAGDTVVDATVGNGHDTLFLAKTVGENGQVIGFDTQAAAIKSTAERTSDMMQVVLHQIGHEHIDEVISTSVKAVTFNLGYLPSGNKEITTTAATTVIALEKAARLLQAGGIITIVVYTGHESGLEEAGEVERWATELKQAEYTAVLYRTLNQRNSPPYLIAVERRFQN